MVQIVVLSANGDKRTMKTTAFAAGSATGATVAKALRKARPAEVIGTYTYKEKTLTVWGWKDGKAGTENKHELPPSNGAEMPLIFGDAVVVGAGEFNEKDYDAFGVNYGNTNNFLDNPSKIHRINIVPNH